MSLPSSEKTTNDEGPAKPSAGGAGRRLGLDEPKKMGGGLMWRDILIGEARDDPYLWAVVALTIYGEI